VYVFLRVSDGMTSTPNSKSAGILSVSSYHFDFVTKSEHRSAIDYSLVK